MKLHYKDYTLDFLETELVFDDDRYENVFADFKKDVTLRKAIENERYKYEPMREYIEYKYSSFLDMPLGTFLWQLKSKEDFFYRQLLNPYGDETYCTFSIDSASEEQKGIYFFSVENDIKYIGLTTNSYKHTVYQYSKISPASCYKSGQSTFCRLNSLIASLQEEISFFVYPMQKDDDMNKVKNYLICTHNPDWNR